MKTESRFKIIEFSNRGGSQSYRVTGCTKDGKQIRKNFSTMESATLFQQDQEREYLGLAKPDVVMHPTRLTPEQIHQAEIVFGQIGDRSLLDVVKFFLENYKETAVAMPLSDAFTKFIAEKELGNNRPDTIRNLKMRIAYLVRQFPTKLVGDVLPDDIKTVINRSNRGPVTRDNDRRAFSSFFGWCQKQGYCATNPVATIDPIKTDREEPNVLSLAEVRELVSAAHTFRNGICEPYLTLALFCAIRPTELSRLTWGDIDLEAKTVTIGAKLAKMRQRRIVSISDNALEFLKLHSEKKTPLRGKNFRRNFDAVKQKAGFAGRGGNGKQFGVDVLRHTGISMHLAQYQHEGQTATWGGNSPDVIQRHYKGLVKQSVAKEFWNITPSNILPPTPPVETEAGK